MYLRTTTRRTKGGETVRYLALAHNERNKRGVSVAKVIQNLGREDLLDRDALVRLVRSIQRFLGGEDGLRAGAPHGFEFVRRSAAARTSSAGCGRSWGSAGRSPASPAPGAGARAWSARSSRSSASAAWSRPPSSRRRAGSAATSS